MILFEKSLQVILTIEVKKNLQRKRFFRDYLVVWTKTYKIDKVRWGFQLSNSSKHENRILKGVFQKWNNMFISPTFFLLSRHASQTGPKYAFSCNLFLKTIFSFCKRFLLKVDTFFIFWKSLYKIRVSCKIASLIHTTPPKFELNKKIEIIKKYIGQFCRKPWENT